MKKITLALIAVVVVSVFLTGCGDSNIALVKVGTMNAYPDVMLEKILEAKFTDTNWSTFEKDGRKYVRFEGKISAKVHQYVANALETYIVHMRTYRTKSEKLFEEVLRPMSRKCSHKEYLVKSKKIEEKFKQDFSDKYIWPIGSDFAIEWVIHPDGENFEMTGITVDNLYPDGRLNPDVVLKYIFAK